MTKPTKRVVENLAPKPKERIVWDQELSGFGIQIYPTGRKDKWGDYLRIIGQCNIF